MVIAASGQEDIKFRPVQERIEHIENVYGYNNKALDHFSSSPLLSPHYLATVEEGGIEQNENHR